MVPTNPVPGFLQFRSVFDTDIAQRVESACEDSSWRKVFESAHRLHSGGYIWMGWSRAKWEVVMSEFKDTVAYI